MEFNNDQISRVCDEDEKGRSEDAMLVNGYVIYVFMLKNNKWFLYATPELESPDNDQIFEFDNDYNKSSENVVESHESMGCNGSTMNGGELAYPAGDDIYMNCTIFNNFVKKNPIIKMKEEIRITNLLEIDFHVKKYMQMYGIENVRGGKYSNEILPLYTIQTLKDELSISKSIYDDNIDFIKSIYNQYTKFIWNNTNITNEKKRIVNEITKYRELNTRIQNIQCDKINNFKLDKSFIMDVEWLKTQVFGSPSSIKKDDREVSMKLRFPDTTVEGVYSDIVQTTDIDYGEFVQYSHEKSAYINGDLVWIADWINQIPAPDLTPPIIMNKTEKHNKYQTIINKLSAINRLFIQRMEESTFSTVVEDSYNSYEPKIYLKMPNLAFDAFIYHMNSLTNINYKDHALSMAEPLMAQFEHMIYTLINRADEYIFELSTYGVDFEKKMTYSLNYLDYMSEKK